MPSFYENIQGWSDFIGFYDKILEMAPENAILVEIGVWKGRSAVYMAELIKETGKKVQFYALDNFAGSSEHVEHLKTLEKTLLEIFMQNLADSGTTEHVKVIIGDSVGAAVNFEDDSIYMAYIDASHEYGFVKKDIEAWWPKIKSGGILGGHDYGSWPGVTQAVNEFVSDNNLVLNPYNYTLRTLGATWYVVKP